MTPLPFSSGEIPSTVFPVSAKMTAVLFALSPIHPCRDSVACDQPRSFVRCFCMEDAVPTLCVRGWDNGSLFSGRDQRLAGSLIIRQSGSSQDHPGPYWLSPCTAATDGSFLEALSSLGCSQPLSPSCPLLRGGRSGEFCLFLSVPP